LQLRGQLLDCLHRGPDELETSCVKRRCQQLTIPEEHDVSASCIQRQGGVIDHGSPLSRRQHQRIDSASVAGGHGEEQGLSSWQIHRLRMERIALRSTQLRKLSCGSARRGDLPQRSGPDEDNLAVITPGSPVEKVHFIRHGGDEAVRQRDGLHDAAVGDSGNRTSVV
jgi:hypothetical protein